MAQVLTPMFEAVFSPHSYGFRPGRSAHQAVQQAQAYIAEGNEWCVDIDIEKFLIVHLDASLKTQVLNGACFELAQGVESFSLIGE